MSVWKLDKISEYYEFNFLDYRYSWPRASFQTQHFQATKMHEPSILVAALWDKIQSRILSFVTQQLAAIVKEAQFTMNA